MKKYLEIGKRLIILRGKKIQIDFAKEIGAKLRTYQNYEAGERAPHIYILTKIAEMCDTTTDWILTGDLNTKKARITERVKAVGYLEEIVEKLEKINRREQRLPLLGVKEKAPEYGLERLEEKDLIEKMRSYIATAKIDFMQPEDRKMVEDLIEILNSGNTDIIDALRANIKAFRGAAKAVKEKRRYYRFSINIPIDVRILDEPGSPAGIIIDASQMGLCIQSSHEMEIGKKIDLEIASSKNNNGTLCRTKAQIMWREGKRLDDSEAYQYGVKLVGLSDEDHAKLESLLGGGE